MGNRHNLIAYIMEQNVLPQESVPGHPIVEISGEHRVLIENHRGVVEYGRDRICVKVKTGIVEVQGSCLQVQCISREHLVIIGRIHCVVLNRRELP